MTAIESLDVKASSAICHIFRKLLNAVFTGSEDDDELSFKDKELLEDVLRYGTILEVAKRSGKNYGSLRYQVEKAVDRLTLRAKNLENKANRIVQAREEGSQSQHLIIAYRQKINSQKEEIKAAKAETAKVESKLKAYLRTQPQLEEFINLKPQYAILEQKLAVAQKELESAQKKVAKYEVELAPLRQTEKAYNKVAGYKTKYEAAKQTISQLKKQVSQLESKEKKLITQNQKLQSEIDRYNVNKQKGSSRDSDKITKLKNRIDSLENLFKEYKKRGLQAIMESDLID